MKYKLIRSRRRTLCLEIRNASLVVRAPYLYPENRITEFIKIKEAWIKKHLDKTKRSFKKRSDQVLISGKLYNIDVNVSDRESFVALGDKVIIKSKDEEAAKELIKKYLLNLTKEKIFFYKNKYADIFNLKNKKTVFKFYKSRWGSCSAKNVLSFNAALSMAPDEVVEYVFIHEVVHIKEKNHKRRFWQKVEQYDPEYKSHRKWLSQNRDMLRI